ncbi:hypothetical protein QOT17_015971 [Balamuthia mandrillaris]
MPPHFTKQTSCFLLLISLWCLFDHLSTDSIGCAVFCQATKNNNNKRTLGTRKMSQDSLGKHEEQRLMKTMQRAEARKGDTWRRQRNQTWAGDHEEESHHEVPTTKAQQRRSLLSVVDIHRIKEEELRREEERKESLRKEAEQKKKLEDYKRKTQPWLYMWNFDEQQGETNTQIRSQEESCSLPLPPNDPADSVGTNNYSRHEEQSIVPIINAATTTSAASGSAVDELESILHSLEVTCEQEAERENGHSQPNKPDTRLPIPILIPLTSPLSMEDAKLKLADLEHGWRLDELSKALCNVYHVSSYKEGLRFMQDLMELSDRENLPYPKVSLHQSSEEKEAFNVTVEVTSLCGVTTKTFMHAAQIDQLPFPPTNHTAALLSAPHPYGTPQSPHTLVKKLRMVKGNLSTPRERLDQFEEFLEAAQAGDVPTMYEIGLRLLKGYARNEFVVSAK